MSTGNRFGTESFCTRSTAWRGLEPLETRLFLSVSPAEEFADPVRVVDGKLQTVEVSFDGYQGEAVGGSWIVTFEQNEQNSRLYKADDGTDFRSFNPAGPATKADDMEAALRLIGREFRFDHYLGNMGAAEIVATVVEGDVSDMAARLMKLPGVVSVTPNWVSASVGSLVPNDPDFSLQTGLENSQDADIDATDAWDYSTGSSSVVVGVIDSGTMTGHPDLAGNIYSNPNEIANNGIDDDGNGFVDNNRGWNFIAGSKDVQDDNGHGTHVAGIIGAVGNNNVGITGVAWDVSILTLKAARAISALSGAVLVVLGNENTGIIDDDILVRIKPTDANVIEVIRNGGLYTSIAKNLVDSILVDAKSGNDTITIDGAITVRTTLKGGDGNDTIYGGSRPDSIEGNAGNDSLYGNLGNDSLAGGQGLDGLFAGNGNDVLTGGDGDDTLTGGGGSDSFIFSNSNVFQTDYVSETGTVVDGDLLDFSGVTTDVTVNLSSADSLLGSHANRDVRLLNSSTLKSNIENVTGGTGDDTITGSAVGNVLLGGPGFDSILGMAGHDTLNGQSNGDYLGGGNGDDEIQGDLGHDNIIGGVGDDTLFGGNGNDTIDGGDGNDLLQGVAGNDSLIGGTGNDWLIGDIGNDILRGADAPGFIDTLDGNSGTDQADRDSGWDILTSIEQIL